MPEPTAIQIRVALAEYLRGEPFPGTRDKQWEKYLASFSLVPVPDYATDLNACAEVEAKLERDGLGIDYERRITSALVPSNAGQSVHLQAEASAYLYCSPAIRARAAYDTLAARDAKGGAKP